MDAQRPIAGQEIAAGWGAAVADALRSQGLRGPGVVRAPSGTSLPTPPLPGPSRAEPPPWRFAAWVAPRPGGQAGWLVRVRKGAVRDASGAGLPFSLPAGFSDAGGWWEAAAPSSDALLSAEASGAGWTLRLGPAGEGGAAWSVPLASIASDGVSRPAVSQLRAGDFAAPPAPAPLTVRKSGASHRIYLPDNALDSIWTRNGALLKPNPSLVATRDSDGWFSLVVPSGGGVVCVLAMSGTAPGYWKTGYGTTASATPANWYVSVAPLSRSSHIVPGAAGNVPVALIGADGAVTQLRTGSVNDNFTGADTELHALLGSTPWYRSVDWAVSGSSGTMALALHGFADGRSDGEISDATDWGSGKLYVVTRERVESAGALQGYRIGYRRISFPQPPQPPQPYSPPSWFTYLEDLFDIPCDYYDDPGAAYAWNPCGGGWVNLGSGKFWETGGDATTCNASAIEVSGTATVGKLAAGSGGATIDGPLVLNGTPFFPVTLSYTDASGAPKTVTVLAAGSPA